MELVYVDSEGVWNNIWKICSLFAFLYVQVNEFVRQFMSFVFRLKYAGSFPWRLSFASLQKSFTSSIVYISERIFFLIAKWEPRWQITYYQVLGIPSFFKSFLWLEVCVISPKWDKAINLFFFSFFSLFEERKLQKVRQNDIKTNGWSLAWLEVYLLYGRLRWRWKRRCVWLYLNFSAIYIVCIIIIISFLGRQKSRPFVCVPWKLASNITLMNLLLQNIVATMHWQNCQFR